MWGDDNKEYLELTEIAKQRELSYEELSRVNELHVDIVVQCFEASMEIQDKFDLLKQAWHDTETLNKACTEFLEEKGLTTEFVAFLKEALGDIELFTVN